MTQTAPLPPEIRDRLQGRNIIVFDGVCAFCNAWVKFVLRFDRGAKFHFVIAQSDLGERLYSHLGLKSDDYETFIVVADNGITTSLDGVFTVLRRIGLPWSVLSVLRILPRGIKDFIYNRVARNRYSIFGKYDTCMIPTPEVRARFID